jgi:protein-S-isoprenylcysteine O-methyltransferase Ste14
MRVVSAVAMALVCAAQTHAFMLTAGASQALRLVPIRRGTCNGTVRPSDPLQRGKRLASGPATVMQLNKDKDEDTDKEGAATDNSAKKVLPSPATILANVLEGSIGERGEAFVGLQFGLVFLVVVAPVFQDAIEDSGLWAGLAISAAGLAFGYAAVQQLGDSLSPWPKPVDKNVLQTDGVFALSRHPIYSGLLITCFGLSLVNASYPRLLFSLLLLLVMDAKAAAEEEFMREKHGDAYTRYCESTPRFFTRDVSLVLKFVLTLLRG